MGVQHRYRAPACGESRAATDLIARRCTAAFHEHWAIVDLNIEQVDLAVPRHDLAGRGDHDVAVEKVVWIWSELLKAPKGQPQAMLRCQATVALHEGTIQGLHGRNCLCTSQSGPDWYWHNAVLNSQGLQ